MTKGSTWPVPNHLHETCGGMLQGDLSHRGILLRPTVAHAGRRLGFSACLYACPLGASPVDRISGIAPNCNLCDGGPACVASCPREAIRYTEMDEVSTGPNRGRTDRYVTSSLGSVSAVDVGPSAASRASCPLVDPQSTLRRFRAALATEAVDMISRVVGRDQNLAAHRRG